MVLVCLDVDFDETIQVTFKFMNHTSVCGYNTFLLSVFETCCCLKKILALCHLYFIHFSLCYVFFSKILLVKK